MSLGYVTQIDSINNENWFLLLFWATATPKTVLRLYNDSY